MDQKPMLIEIRTNPRFVPRRVLMALAIQIIPIGIGILAGSAAMQWSGFVMSILILIVAAVVTAKETTGITIQQARELLDKIASDEVE